MVKKSSGDSVKKQSIVLWKNRIRSWFV